MTGPSLTVLVVSDDPHLSSEITYAFPDDVSVSFALNAREALPLMGESIPSVVVVDIRTGSAGGYGLSRDMSANDRLHDIPRLMLLERAQDSWLAKQAGATEYLVKPVPNDELVARALALNSQVTTH
ncbi:MAG: response regulator [Actinomycetota bacterium]